MAPPDGTSQIQFTGDTAPTGAGKAYQRRRPSKSDQERTPDTEKERKMLEKLENDGPFVLYSSLLMGCYKPEGHLLKTVQFIYLTWNLWSPESHKERKSTAERMYRSVYKFSLEKPTDGSKVLEATKQYTRQSIQPLIFFMMPNESQMRAFFNSIKDNTEMMGNWIRLCFWLTAFRSNDVDMKMSDTKEIEVYDQPDWIPSFGWYDALQGTDGKKDIEIEATIKNFLPIKTLIEAIQKQEDAEDEESGKADDETSIASTSGQKQVSSQELEAGVIEDVKEWVLQSNRKAAYRDDLDRLNGLMQRVLIAMFFDLGDLQKLANMGFTALVPLQSTVQGDNFTNNLLAQLELFIVGDELQQRSIFSNNPRLLSLNRLLGDYMKKSVALARTRRDQKIADNRAKEEAKIFRENIYVITITAIIVGIATLYPLFAQAREDGAPTGN